MRLVVRNGTVVTPTGIVRGGLVCEDGLIAHVGPDSMLPNDTEAVDAEGKWVLPGVIDPHTHIGVGPADARAERLFTRALRRS